MEEDSTRSLKDAYYTLAEERPGAHSLRGQKGAFISRAKGAMPTSIDSFSGTRTLE